MIIVEDTRNQLEKHKNIHEYFNKNNITYIRSKLYVGDYSNLSNQSICIDTKKNWLEVANNICGKQHERFRAECVRAKESNIQLIVLVEENCSVLDWKIPKKKGKPITAVNPSTLHNAMKTMTDRYGVVFAYCDKANTGSIVYRILKEKDNGNN